MKRISGFVIGITCLLALGAPAFAATTDTSITWEGGGNSNKGTLGPINVTMSTAANGSSGSCTANWSSDAASNAGGTISYTDPSCDAMGTMAGSTSQTVTFTGGSVVNPILLFDYVESTTSIVLSGGSPTVVSSSNCSLTSLTITCPTATRGMNDGIAVKLTGTFSSISFTYSDSAGTGTATAGFSVAVSPVLPPSISKAFGASQMVPGGTTSVTLTITNPNTSTTLSGVAFTDTLPAGMTVATPNNLSSTCGGTATATAGTGTISLSGGSIAGNSNCTVSANITAGEGSYTNSVQVSSTNGGTGNTAMASIQVASTPILTKAFGAPVIGFTGTTSLTFNLTNPNASTTLSPLAFTDTLPSGLVVSTPNGLTGSCGGGTIAATPGGNTISLSGASLAATNSCTFKVNVTGNGTAQGTVTNTTSTVTSTQALPGAAATAIVFIGDPLLVSYAANLNIGESYIDVQNTGANGNNAQGPGFGTLTGNICVNVYAFDPNEELIACCSCLVTPDQTVNLGVNANLVSKTLTGVVPTSVTVKLIATAPAGTSATNGGNCTNSAANVMVANLVNGVSAWGTTLHGTPTAGSYATTEDPFTGATLSSSELSSVTGRCSNIIGNASGFGICSTCRTGALGGSKAP